MFLMSRAEDCAPGLAVVVPVIGGLTGVVLVHGVLGDEYAVNQEYSADIWWRAHGAASVAWWTW
jgi:hypothetical protein